MNPDLGLLVKDWVTETFDPHFFYRPVEEMGPKGIYGFIRCVCANYFCALVRVDSRTNSLYVIDPATSIAITDSGGEYKDYLIIPIANPDAFETCRKAIDDIHPLGKKLWEERELKRAHKNFANQIWYPHAKA